MIIIKESPISGELHSIEVPLSEEEYQKCFDLWQTRSIEEAFPMLTEEEREFILLGVTQKEWEELIY